MVRRDTWAVEVEQLRLDGGPRTLQTQSGEDCAVLVAITGCDVTSENALVPLGPLDALMLPNAAHPLMVQGPPVGTAVFARFRRL